jgi:hypothetical protein
MKPWNVFLMGVSWIIVIFLCASLFQYLELKQRGENDRKMWVIQHEQTK